MIYMSKSSNYHATTTYQFELHTQNLHSYINSKQQSETECKSQSLNCMWRVHAECAHIIIVMPTNLQVECEGLK